MAGNNQQHHHAIDFFLAQLIARFLGLNQGCDQVVAWLLTPSGKNFPQVRDHFIEQSFMQSPLFLITRRCHKGIRPGAEAVTIRRRDAQ